MEIRNDIQKIKKIETNEVSKFDTTSIFRLGKDEIEKIKPHQFMEVIPEASIEEYEALKLDIISTSMEEPIIITRDFLCVDGRTRLRIYRENSDKVDPIFKYCNENGNELVDFILRRNILKRNLTKGQKAITAIRTYQYVLETREKKGNGKILGLDLSEFNKSRDLVAKYFGISSTYISYAFKVSEERPEYIKEISSGKLSLLNAYNQIVQENKPNNNLEEDEGIDIESCDITTDNIPCSYNSCITTSDIETTTEDLVTESEGSLTSDKQKKEKEEVTKVLQEEEFKNKYGGFTELEEQTINFITDFGFNEDSVTNKIRTKAIKERKAISTFDNTSPNALFSAFLEDFYSHLPEDDYTKSQKEELEKKVSISFSSEPNSEDLVLEKKIELLFTHLNKEEQKQFKSSMASVKKANSQIAEGERITDIVKNFIQNISGLLS